ncbi:MAG: gtaB [Gammaproteobacteria bacterium]|nr:gtaB [Gammaproteobacteria bacterium]
MFIPIKKAVFPVAGLGTRFLPATKANPKEMLPIVDKPLIQYAVEEAVYAGITELIFVTSSSKRAIEDHFDSNFELEAKLQEKEAYSLLALVQDILPKGISCAYIRQNKPLGLGHAVLCAKNIIGDEPFAVLLADDLIETTNEHSCLKQMVRKYEATQSSVLAIESVAPEETSKYGIISLDGNSDKLKDIIEKPSPQEAPSNLAVVGRYIFTPHILQLLENVQIDSRGEIQLTDAISALTKVEDVYSYLLDGKRHDCGSKLGYLQATISYGLKHPEIGEAFKQYLASLSFS